MSRRARTPDGAAGWDTYAAFYDWENAQTVGRRDIPFWVALAKRTRGRVLELGAGTGRLTIPLARAIGTRLVGIDRSAEMLARAANRLRRLPSRRRPLLVRGDIRALPCPDASLGLVIAPYGMLQSLTRERDLVRLLDEVARVLRPGGVFGVDLVPDLPVWDEYRDQVRLTGPGPGGTRIRLVESVRQDRRRRLTLFDQTFIQTRGRTRTRHHFTLAFRTLPVPQVAARLGRAGLALDGAYGDYRGR